MPAWRQDIPEIVRRADIRIFVSILTELRQDEQDLQDFTLCNSVSRLDHEEDTACIVFPKTHLSLSLITSATIKKPPKVPVPKETRHSPL